MKKERRVRPERERAQDTDGTAGQSRDGQTARGTKKAPRALGFAQKLTLAMLLVLAMALSLGGTAVLAGNFDDALDEAGQQAEAQHLLQCYALESDLLDVAARGETVTDSHLARYGSSLANYVGGKLVALYRGDAAADGPAQNTASSAAPQSTQTQADGPAQEQTALGFSAEQERAAKAAIAAQSESAAQSGSAAQKPDAGAPQPEEQRMVYTSFPWDERPEGQTDAYRMHRENGRTYMLFETQVETVGNPAVTLLTGHDVTSVFSARNRALLRFWEMELVVLVCAGAMIALLSRWLTKPLARLTQASKSIAAGAYGERTGLSGGDEIGALSHSFDAMAAAVQEKVDALELSVRQREDFMAAFTHELKTPMTAVIGYADTLRSMQCEPEQQQRAANYIFTEARRVEALSEKLLQLLGLRGQPPALEPLRLERVFTRVKAALGPSVAPVEPRFQPAPDVWVRGDADLLVDLLYNLVQNAARAKPKDGCVHIGWQMAPDGAGVDVTVRDTGCGIPAAALARVTEPFYMVDKSRARAGGGSGMGLALCEKIAVLHGGSLRLESVEGEGTAVTVRVPAAENGEGGAAR